MSSEQQPGSDTPKVRHTGFKTLAYDTVSDFKAFPRRRSRWVIEEIGGAAALLEHLIDDDVTECLSDSEGAKDFFAPASTFGGRFRSRKSWPTGLLIAGRQALRGTREDA